MTVSCSCGKCCFPVELADLPDLLVPLYALPVASEPEGLWVGKPLPHQSPSVLSFIGDNFSSGWKAEAGTAFGSVPTSIMVAVDKASGRLAGFCCWDCTAKGFLGPIGVHDDFHGKGVGKAVVLAALHSMREAGYGYAVIGDAGPVEFFQRICDARIIEGSTPGIYGNPLP
ncbi:GNAT family N-acetyltransferase [Candidatus Fermentibacteria bacterium]|nr:MAG: GNAT family N-acetyltransferase [Candidatus Fermentibacteria bacterium]